MICPGGSSLSFARYGLPGPIIRQGVFLKWFKHLSAARRDPKIVSLRLRDGREGVCRWWEIVEMIAEEMNETDRCELIINGAFISRELGFRSSIDGRSFVDRLATGGLLIADLSSTDWVLKCPKLLELRDHRIKNRIHKSAPEQNRTEVDKIRTPIVPKGDDKKFQEFWNQYPRKIGRAKVEKIWERIMRDNINSKAPFDLAHKIIESVQAQKKTDQLGNPDQKFIPYPATWLNQKRWQDEIEIKRLNGSGSTIDPSMGDWSKIREHIQRRGTSVKLEGISEVGRAALNAIGGMPVLGMARSEQMPFLQKDFKNAFLTLQSERKI